MASALVFDEVAKGDEGAARARLALLSNVEQLEITAEVEELVDALMLQGALPSNASDDATHIAVATVYCIDYLVTWNPKHIANPVKLPDVYRALSALNYPSLGICTPARLMEVPNGRTPRP